MLRRLTNVLGTTVDADMSSTSASDMMIQQSEVVTKMPNASVLMNRRRSREEVEDDDDESADSSIIPHQRAPRTLYDILHFVVWNGYGREVGRAIGASKILDTAEMYESKYGLAQLVYQRRFSENYLRLRTRLMFAAMKGNMARTRLLLANRADVHVDDDRALQLAISNAHADVARLLIEHGADVRVAFVGWMQCENGVDVASYRALIRELMNAHPAVSSGDILAIAIINSDAALVSQTVDAGFVAWGDKAREMLYDNDLLGECIEYQTGPEITATARALCSHPFFTFRDTIVIAGRVASYNKDGIAWVRDLSASPEAAANVDELLRAGSLAGLVDVVQACLDRGGDPNFYDPDLESTDCAIMRAAQNGHDDVVVMLAQREEIDTNMALVAATYIGSLDLCTDLLNRGADAGWATEIWHESALKYSIEMRYVEILRLLLKHRSARRLARRYTYLFQRAMKAGTTDANAMVRILLKKKILPNLEDLCFAAEAGKRHIVRDILDAEVEGVNVRSSVTQEADAHGQMSEFASFTPLLSACYGLQMKRQGDNPVSESDYLSLVRLLCEAGANLEARIAVTSPRVVKDGFGGGFTPLLLAARGGSAAVVDELILRDADINGRCANGQTALFYAREQGHDDIAQALVARGATL